MMYSNQMQTSRNQTIQTLLLRTLADVTASKAADWTGDKTCIIQQSAIVEQAWEFVKITVVIEFLTGKLGVSDWDGKS